MSKSWCPIVELDQCISYNFSGRLPIFMIALV